MKNIFFLTTKKRIALFLFFIGVFVAFFIVSFFCFFNFKKPINVVKNKISDNRLGIFNAYEDDFYVEYTYGFREEPFLFNGKSESKKEFGVFVVVFKKPLSYFNFKAKIKFLKSQKEILFEHSPYDNSFAVDIEKIVEANEIYFEIVESEHKGKTAVLKNESNAFCINNSKALELGVLHFETDFKNMIKNKTNFECYLKIMSNSSFKQFFWYFAFESETEIKKHLIIDVFSGEIVAQNFEY